MSAHPVAPTRSPPSDGHAGLGGAIRFNLILPTARFGFGPISFNPIEQAIGAPVADILESLMTGPVTKRPSAAGPAVDVYPLALPDDEGLTVPLGQWGELGFRNLCCAGHKLRYAEPAVMRSAGADIPCWDGALVLESPHNQGGLLSCASAGGCHA